MEQNFNQNIALEHEQTFASDDERNNAWKSKRGFEAIVKTKCEQILVSTFGTHRRVDFG